MDASRGPAPSSLLILSLTSCLLAMALPWSELGAQETGEVVYSTFSGLCRRHSGIQDLVVDETDHTYVAGHAPYLCDREPPEAFVSKFTPTGELVFRKELGGHLSDEAKAITLDAAGNVYVTGGTHGTCCRPFPLVDPFQAERGGNGDAFVVKLDPTGETILYATFLGGNGFDHGTDIAVDADGRILVVGTTDSADFPAGTIGETELAGGTDAFLAILDPTGSELEVSALFGGTADDEAVRMELAAGRIFLAGTTASPDLPMVGPAPSYGGGASDAFLARYAGTGELEHATYLGGEGADGAWALAVREGSVYLTGHTESPDFPTVDPLQESLSFPPDPDAFLTRLDDLGEEMAYSTYLATGEPAICDPLETATAAPCGGIALDAEGAAYVTAPRTFVAKIAPAGDRREYTFHGYGGSALALGPDGAIHVAGTTDLPGALVYPRVDAYSPETNLDQRDIGWLLEREDGPNPFPDFEEDDARVETTGTWELDMSGEFGGGAAVRSNDPGSTLSITFAGTGIRVYGRRAPSAGIVNTQLSPNDVALVPPGVDLDTYTAVPEDRSLVYARSGLPDGEHTLTFEVLGEGSERAEDAWFWLDGFDVDEMPLVPCEPSDTTMCLNGGRFRVEVEWRDYEGNTGSGKAVPSGSDDSGLFWFFDEENWEMLVKVLDGCAINGRHWVFAASSTDVEFELRVTDTATNELANYFNGLGSKAEAIADIEALHGCGEASVATAVHGGARTGAPSPSPVERSIAGKSLRTSAQELSTCVPGPAAMCLNQDRFRVEVRWETASGDRGSGQVVPFGTDDSGLFSFFREDNWEVLVKVLDGCAINDRFWVFAAATTTVGYTLTVTDTETEAARTYHNEVGQRAETITDSDAFAGCPGG